MRRWLRQTVYGRPAARLIVLAAGVALVWVLAGLAPAQERDADVQLILMPEPRDKAPAEGKVPRQGALRPNVEQEILTYVRGRIAPERKVAVVLKAGDNPVARVDVPASMKTWTKVDWPRPDKAPADKPVPPAELTGPVTFQLVEGDKVLQTTRPLFAAKPDSFLKAKLIYLPPAEGRPNSLSLTIWPDPPLTGPKAEVKLVLDPEQIPGYQPEVRRAKGVLNSYVTADNTEENPVILFAEDIQTTAKEGWVSVSVDNYTRAFSFLTTFSMTAKTAGEPQPNTKPTLGVRPVVPTDPRAKIRVYVETENLDPRNEPQLRLGIRPTLPAALAKEAKVPPVAPLAIFEGARQERLTYAAGGRHGGLLFKADVSDWYTELDRRDVNGTITFVAQLFQKDEKKPGDDHKVLTDVRAANGPTSDSPIPTNLVDAVTRVLILDDTPPVIDALAVAVDTKTSKPFPVIPGKKVWLRALGHDDESGIREVTFFAGKPTDQGIIPVAAATTKAKAPAGKELGWLGEFDVPEGLTGPLVVSVRFTNKVGLTKDFTATIPLTPGAGPAGPKKATIAGVIWSGDRPQAGLPVVLSSGGRVIKETTTDDYGAYIFRNVDPATYIVSSVRTADSTQGQTLPFTIEGTEDKKDVDVKLYR
jgi:hypothetical protein